MHVDQKQVTTVNFLDGRTHDFVVCRDGWGFKLSSVSKEDVVHILLSPRDFDKLRQEIINSKGIEIKKGTLTVPEKRDNIPVPVGACVFQWSTADWLSFN